MKAVKFSVQLGLMVGLLNGFWITSASAQNFTGPDLINWVNGPAKADLGANAEIEVPQGFSFVSGQDAATVLKMMNNPAPASLAGILTPLSRKYLIIFEYNSPGYVKNAHRQKIDSAVVLKHLKGSNLGTPISSVEWQTEPRFERDQNILEWALLAQTASGKTVNHVVRLLGREGMIDAIAVQSAGSSELVPLKQLVSRISFKPGYSYADYQQGDKLSEKNLAELIVGESAPDLQTASSNNLAYAVAGGVLVLLGAGILVVRRKKAVPASAFPKSTMLASMSSPHANGNGNGNGSTPSTLSSTKNGNHIHGNGASKSQRRRMFDYQRYYIDLMSQVSDRAEGSSPMPRGPSRSAIQLKAGAAEPATHQMIEISPATVAANLSLIESQKRLIEEQQRLIREQTKLIEEKTKLIQEKNQVLDKQSELFGNNVF